MVAPVHPPPPPPNRWRQWVMRQNTEPPPLPEQAREVAWIEWVIMAWCYFLLCGLIYSALRWWFIFTGLPEWTAIVLSAGSTFVGFCVLTLKAVYEWGG